MIFIKLWAERSNNIIEKAELRLEFQDLKPHVVGSYFGTYPQPGYNLVDHQFKTTEDAQDFLKLTCDEFLDKYPDCKGFIKLNKDEPTKIIGSSVERLKKFVEA